MPTTKKNKLVPLLVDCVKLPPFDAHNFAAIQKAFKPVKPIPMRQSWLPKEEAHFAPGLVRIGWHTNALLVFAELSDPDILTRATTINQRLWALGDSFEIFLKPVGQSSYTELQVAPNNCQLQLQFPNASAVNKARKADDFKPYLISGAAFFSATRVKQSLHKWFVFAKIPKDFVFEKPQALDEKKWRFSFSRYEYASKRPKPVVSSTSPHAKPEFHSQKEWGTMCFRSGK
jgi:hypothetical protein